MSALAIPDALADKLVLLETRARQGVAHAIELAALAKVAIVRGNLREAWAWTCRGFRDDALHPQIHSCLLDLAARMPVDETAPLLDLVLRYDRRPEVLARVLPLRHGGGGLGRIVAHAHATVSGVELWFAARRPNSFAVIVRDGTGETPISVTPQSDPPLARAFGYAAHVFVPWGPSATFVEFKSIGEDIVWLQQCLHRPLKPTIPAPAPAGDRRTTVLVPVHGDAESFRACLESLFGDGEPSSRRRLLLINDASAEPAIADLLAAAAARGAEVLENERNIGFTASVNRGLLHAGGGDVVLLNSDTIVAPMWLSRLKCVAATDGSIGTVTPLTNNGESVSAPHPFRSNPLRPAGEIHRLSDRLWALYGPRTVDIPAGIGFCLYISQAARLAGGLLDDLNFGRGYLEEVDFCLRLKAAGFRNVCAPGVYIGHKGAASFGLEKSYLVARNRKVLRELYPRHEADYQHFALSDPLREMRSHCR